jgi:hypothetical protein
MAKVTDTVQKTVLAIKPERTNFLHMLALNANYFGNIPGSKLKPAMTMIDDNTYESISCLAYNPDTEDMEAVIHINRSNGYGGNLCSGGSIEYVRFYLDFHDGKGLVDQGAVAFNVHDIPAENDCTGNHVFPLSYALTLKKKTPWFSLCTTPELPRMRAILSWNHEPPADSPDWAPVWGDRANVDIQIKPELIFDPLHIATTEVSKFIKQAALSPHLSVAQLQTISKVNLANVHPAPVKQPFEVFAKEAIAANVPHTRVAFNVVQNIMAKPTAPQSLADKATLATLKIDLASVIKELGTTIVADKTEANVDFEQLGCIGLDYNTESLVATIKIKKNSGYTGNLCSAGSTEYVAFWIDWDNKCKWTYLNTMQITVHDINMPGDGLYYSLSLPLNAAMYRKLCENPNIVRVRGVLSWNHAPSTTDPNKLEYYGNRVDSHVQIKPGPVAVAGKPLYTILGGIDVAHINDASGLTQKYGILDPFFAFNNDAVPVGSAFGGRIVVNGPLSTGKYRFKITNLSDSTSRYATESFIAVGFLPYEPYVQWTTVTPNPVTGFMEFLPYEKNILSVLANFVPGGESKVRIDMELETAPGLYFSKTIQMDNTNPSLNLTVNDGGNCAFFHKGQPITGTFAVSDLRLHDWSFGSTWGGADSGGATPNSVSKTFNIPTLATSNPCGNVWLYGHDLTVQDSAYMRSAVDLYHTICLQA